MGLREVTIENGFEVLYLQKSDTFSVNKTEISQFHNTEYCES